MEQNKSSSIGGNPDVKFPPTSGNAIPFSEDGKITGWSAIPSNGSGFITYSNGKINFLSAPSGNYMVLVQSGFINFKSIPDDVKVVTSVNGTIQFVSVPDDKDIKVFNNELKWTDTENCT